MQTVEFLIPETTGDYCLLYCLFLVLLSRVIKTFTEMAQKAIMFPAIIISLYSYFRCSFFHFTRIITYVARVNDVFFSSLLNSNHILFYYILYLRCFIYFDKQVRLSGVFKYSGTTVMLSWIHYTININKRLQIIPR